MSTKAPSNIGVMDLDKRAVRALTRPMLVVEDDPEYAPSVTAAQFLTIAKKYYGLDPPD